MASASLSKTELPVSSLKSAYLQTYRVRGIPLDYNHAQTKELLRRLFRSTSSSILIGSLAVEAGKQSQTATVTFEPIPSELSAGKDEWSLSNDDALDESAAQSAHVTVDTHFRGITTLRSIPGASSHKMDCLAITGLNGHAFGSFKQRGASYMWLRDSLPHDLPGTRIMIYGFDTRLSGSQSSQDLESLASTLRELLDLNLIKSSSAPKQVRPLVFIAFSLGGLLIKQAVIQMGRNNNTQILLKAIYGILFIGVPNQGLDISSLVAMVEGQPNESFLHSLSKNSQLLRDQFREFSKIFYFKDSEVVCFYETLQSPSARFNEHNSLWEMKGPKVTLVDISSATHGRSHEIESHHIQGLNKAHSDLVKLSRHDSDYDLFVSHLRRFESKARGVVQGRLASSSPSEIDRKPQEFSTLQKECLQSLSYQGMYTRQETISLPMRDTCLWFRETAEFRDWLSDVHPKDRLALLWIKGNPGSGKSVLMREILTHMRTRDNGCIILSFFFNTRGSSNDIQFMGLLKSFVHQLIQQDNSTLQRVTDDFKKKNDTLKSDWSWEKRELQAHISEALGAITTESVVILVDALDECEENEVREVVSFMRYLLSITSLNDRESGLYICLASRHYPHISAPGCYELVVQSHNRDDIAKYAQAVLKLESPEELQLREEVIKRASGSFLWVVLVCKRLAKLNDQGRIGKSWAELKNIPSELKDLFGQSFKSIDQEDRDLSIRLLQWVLLARRPMKLREIQYALHFSLTSKFKTQESFEKSEEYSGSDKDLRLLIQDLSAGLIEVVYESSSSTLTPGQWNGSDVEDNYSNNADYGSSDDEDSMSLASSATAGSVSFILQFIHDSVRDFFFEGDGFLLLELDSKAENLHGLGHEFLCKGCINYVSIKELEYFTYEQQQSLQEDKEFWNRFPFLQYAVMELFGHAAAAERAGRNQAYLNAAFRNGNDFENHPWTLIHGLMNHEFERHYRSLLDFLSMHGILSSVRILVEAEGLKKDETGSLGFLQAASANGHEAVLKLLLEQGANVEAIDGSGHVPLAQAATYGHEGVVKLLLENGANTEVKDQLGESPLYKAAKCGHEGVVKLLLENGANTEVKNSREESPLHIAAAHGHEGVVKLLLENGANVKVKNSQNESPLRIATAYGHEEVADLLFYWEIKQTSRSRIS